MNVLTLLPHLFEAAYVVDENRKILYCNEMFEKITGYKKDEIIGRYCYDNILRHVSNSGKHLCHDGCPLQESMSKSRINQAKLYLHHKQGYRIPVNVKTIPYIDETTQKQNGIEIFSDLREESLVNQENRKLKKSVSTDELTQIFNRRFMDYQLNTSINEYRTFKTPLALLFLDLDHFKEVNDKYGHDVGDLVLKTIAKTLVFNIKQNDFVGRFGGEEFIVLLRDVSVEEMRLVAEKLRSLISKTTIKVSDEQQIEVTVSIGCSYYRETMTKDDLIKEADTFMYKAKNTGRNKVVSK